MATARLFAERGATLLLTGRNVGAGEALAAELGAQFLAADVASPNAPAILMAWAEQIHDRLDILVNNAGILFQEELPNLHRRAMGHDHGSQCHRRLPPVPRRCVHHGAAGWWGHRQCRLGLGLGRRGTGRGVRHQ